MNRAFLLFLPAFVVGSSLAAQTTQASGANPAVSTVKQLWTGLTGYITQAAEEMPEADYAYRPTPAVRSFGQQIAHVAGAQNLICAAALGETTRSEDEIERTMTKKADIIAALKASTEYCARAYAQADAVTQQQKTQLFGQERTRFHALTLNATHNAEHYGNIVTYMRLKGMVPPSSRGQ